MMFHDCYDILQLNVNDYHTFEKIVQLQRIVYPARSQDFSINGFRLWYCKNPMGPVISFNAFYKDEMVAHYACVPIKMMMKGRIVDGLLDMSTVTHPAHRGRGLFRTLAQTTYSYAFKQGYEFVIGVANANSFPGYMKYFDFTFVSKLDVKFGYGAKIFDCAREKPFYVYWDKVALSWRASIKAYSIHNDFLAGHLEFMRISNFLGIKLIMGYYDKTLLEAIKVKGCRDILRPLNLYIGIGADLSKGHYFNVPWFIKHSPFNLIFLDLTGGKLPTISRDNVFFQLMDFDVA